MYLYSPEGTIEDFLYNMELAIRNKGKNPTTEEIDHALGNKLSAYRLLSFIAKNGSEFDKNFEKWTDEIDKDKSYKIDQKFKDQAKNRWKYIKELMALLKNIEDSFSPSDGTKANQLLNLLSNSLD